MRKLIIRPFNAAAINNGQNHSVAKAMSNDDDDDDDYDDWSLSLSPWIIMNCVSYARPLFIHSDYKPQCNATRAQRAITAIQFIIFIFALLIAIVSPFLLTSSLYCSLTRFFSFFTLCRSNKSTLRKTETKIEGKRDKNRKREENREVDTDRKREKFRSSEKQRQR